MLGLIGLEELDFLRQGAGEVGLLHAFGIHELFLAKLQNLPVVKGNREGADEQQGAQDEPKYANAARPQAFDEGWKARRHRFLLF